ATLVGVSEYYRHGGQLPHYEMTALGFEVMFGALTVTGSFMAFAKLQELMRGAPITYKFQNFSNIALFVVTLGIFVYLIVNPTDQRAFYAMIGLGALIGILIVLPIGGADMPVVISLLNSYAGLASAATGFVLQNNVLISKAMNRSFGNVLFGAFGSSETAAAALKAAQEKTVRAISPEDAGIQLA